MLITYGTQYRCSVSKKTDTKGIIMPPIFDIEPRDYIVPILHLLIGIVNKGWTSLGHFLDEFVENVSKEEAELKDRKHEIENELSYLDDEVDIYTVSKTMALEIIEEEDGTDNSETTLQARDVHKNAIQQIKILVEERKSKMKELRQVKLNLEREKQQRAGDEAGIDNLLFDILEQYNIKKQSFHGGAMNGVCCRRLLDNIDNIFCEINTIIETKVSSKKSFVYTEMTRLTGVVDMFKLLFEYMDVVFSKLRILDPSESEIEEIDTAIKGLEKLWRQLDLNITPKMHILTYHTIEQVRRFGGIADKVEDFIEKSHQIGKMLDHLVARMSHQSFRQQEMVKIRRQWLTSDPSVSNQLSSIHQQQKRHLNPSHKNRLTKAETHKRVKMEKRKETMEQLVSLRSLSSASMNQT